MSIFVIIFLFLIFALLWPVIKIAFKIWGFRRQMKRAYRQAYGEDPRTSGRQGSRHTQQRRHGASGRYSSPYYDNNDPYAATGRRGKRIPDDIGEYIEFEEITDYVPEPERPPVKYKKQQQISDAEWEEIK